MNTSTRDERLAAVTPYLFERIRQSLDEDSAFRAGFIADPRGAWQARFGEDLLPGERIEVRPGEDGGHAVVVRDLNLTLTLDRDGRVCLPDELSDEMLEVVSGGGSGGSKPSRETA